jgi:hypothetical protein
MPALLLLLLLPCLSFAQPDTTWSRTFLINDRCSLYDVEIVHDTLVVGVGYSQIGIPSTDLNYMICAYTTSGDSVYARTILETEDNESLVGLMNFSGDTMIATGWSTDVGRELNLISFLASTGEVLWERGYAIAGRTKGKNLCKLADGRFAVVGYRGGIVDPTHSDVWVLLCEANGDTVWTRAFGGTNTDIGDDIGQLPNGNLLIASETFNNFGAQAWDIMRLEVDLNGNQVGSIQLFGSAFSESCYNSVLDPFGNYWYIGKSTAMGGEGYAVVIPSTGAPYIVDYSTENYGDSFIDGIPWFGGMLFVGKSGNSGSLTGPFMRAIDEENESRWVWRYGALALDGGFNSITPRSDGGAISVGAFVSDPDTIMSAYILSISPPAGIQGTVRSANDGEPIVGARVHELGSTRYAVTDAEGIYQLEITAGVHDIVVSGNCIESDTMPGVVVDENDLTMLDFEVGEPLFSNLQSSVNIISQNEMTSSETITLANSGTGAMQYRLSVEGLSPPGPWLSVSPSEGILQPNESTEITVSVEADTTNDGTFEFFGELTIRSNACPDTVIVLPVLASVLDVDDRTALPTEFSLSRAYPNPFNSNTSITLSLPHETHVRMEVYNIAGKWVQTLVDGPVLSGNHNINIDLTGSASGLYFVRAVTPTTNASQKLLYIR